MAETEYVILRATKDAEFEVYKMGAKGINGVAAIKRGTLLADGTHAEGKFRAVPLGTWDAESNQLEIEIETKPRSIFKTIKAKTPSPNGAPSTKATAKK